MKENRRDVRIVASATAIVSTLIEAAGLVSGQFGLPVMAVATVALLGACGVVRITEIRKTLRDGDLDA